MCRWNRVPFPAPTPSPASGPRSDAPIPPPRQVASRALHVQQQQAMDQQKAELRKAASAAAAAPADARHKEASFARRAAAGAAAGAPAAAAGARRRHSVTCGSGGAGAPSVLDSEAPRRPSVEAGDELEWGAFATRAGLFTGLPGFGGGGGGAAAAAAPAAEPPSLASKIWGFDQANGAAGAPPGQKKSGEDGLFEKGTVGFEQGVGGGGGGGGAVGFKEASFARRGTLRSPEVPPADGSGGINPLKEPSFARRRGTVAPTEPSCIRRGTFAPLKPKAEAKPAAPLRFPKLPRPTSKMHIDYGKSRFQARAAPHRPRTQHPSLTQRNPFSSLAGATRRARAPRLPPPKVLEARGQHRRRGEAAG